MTTKQIAKSAVPNPEKKTATRYSAYVELANGERLYVGETGLKKSQLDGVLFASKNDAEIVSKNVASSYEKLRGVKTNPHVVIRRNVPADIETRKVASISKRKTTPAKKSAGKFRAKKSTAKKPTAKRTPVKKSAKKK